MASWYSTWLPGLPSLNFALPTNLQRRFISFVLKKSLGHFLRPGQLDYHQVDSQINSGNITINDLELDDKAINDLISDLPVVLHDGHISSVVAKVPWPNPLTSTLGFSIDSLHLTFHLLPATPHHTQHNSSNLADSVASVAESFVHDELTPQELWDSFHPDIAATSREEDDLTIPGGLAADPFVSSPEEVVHSDVDPAGVSIFATLIERLLARFEFDAANTKVTVVHPGNMSITLSISEIRYRTDASGDTSQSTSSTGQKRTVSITGLNVTALNLRAEAPFFDSFTPNTRPPSSSPPSPSTPSPHGSPSSSSSSLDEDTQFAMSQSLAFLPPRPISPTSSVASSMYQSAISTASTSINKEGVDDDSRGSRTPSPSLSTIPHTGAPPSNAERAEILVSFGSSPILIHISTTPSTAPATEVPSFPQTPPPMQGTVMGDESLGLAVTLGTIACALRAWHIRGLLSLADSFTPPSENREDPDSNTSRSGLDCRISVEVRGVVLLIPMPPSLDGNLIQDTSLADFFKWPLVPPTLPYGYLRLYLETISASVTSSSATEEMKRARSTRSIAAKPLSCGLTVGDVSLFSISKTASFSTAEPILWASPILITDPDLSRQYSVHHHHPSKDSHDSSLPIFEVMDWTDEKHRSNGLKLSSWRTKSNRRLAQHEGRVDSGPFSPAISATFKRRVASSHRLATGVDEIDIQVIPLHVLLDLGTALRADRILAFLDEAVGDRAESGYGSKYEPRRSGCHESGDSDGDAETPCASPRARNAHEREEQRRRLEKLVLEDLDLDIDYGVHRRTGGPSPIKPRAHKSIAKDKPNLKTSVAFEMIRVQVRCPSPPQYPPRSGALVFDLNGIRLFTAPEASGKAARFAVNEESDVTRPASESFILGAAFERLVVSCSPAHDSAATSILSVGLLAARTDDSDLRDTVEPVAPLHPRIAITQFKPASAEIVTVTALSIDIPSVVVDISKPILDSLQYWADDVAQHMDRTFNEERLGGNDETRTEKADSRDASLIGSRFFVKSRSGSGSALSGRATPSRPETAIKLLISEAFVRAVVPRVEGGSIRPFIVAASDIDLLVELNPEGKEETNITLGLMAVSLVNMPSAQSSQTFISLTSPRSLASVPKPMVKLRFTSLVVPGTSAKESRVKLTLSGFTFTLFPNISWITDLGTFAKSPPGTFESVIPSERTRISLKISDGAIRTLAPNHPGAVVVQVEDLDFATDVVGKSPDSSFRLSIPAVALLAVDDVSTAVDVDKVPSRHGVALWTSAGFALLAEIEDLSMGFTHTSKPPTTNICIDRVRFQAHICADSLLAVTEFSSDLATVFQFPSDEGKPKRNRGPTMISKKPPVGRGLMSSVDDLAFKKVPDVGPAPDMIGDDLPTNMDYLDESFGTAAGLRELRDDDLDEFDIDESQPELFTAAPEDGTGVTSRIGGETIKVFRSEGIQVTENYFDDMPPASGGTVDESTEATFQLRIRDGDITLFLYDGYDWVKTRKTIEEEVKDMRRRLAKIRQLVASGQAQDPNGEETGALLFNSLYIGLDPDVEPGDIIAAIDDELKEDVETASQSSWQSLKPALSGKPQGLSVRVHGKRLTRSRNPSLEFRLFGLFAEVDHYLPDSAVVSRTLVTVRDLEILDHIKTSTWKKFLTSLRSDSRGNVRETDSNMVRIELRSVRPVPGHPVEEARLRAKILPLRLYVDQDAVDFLKAFFSFKNPDASPATHSGDDGGDIYFREQVGRSLERIALMMIAESAEVFPIDLKLDYKPRRVDYRALREGRTIELMNFFHFDGAEMTLRHITLSGITGWPRLFDLLNDLWTPDVKATQLVEVISGVAPIRSVVNVGSGVADLVLLPIAQYKKDGRIVRGVQKGTNAFVKSTAIEAIKLGARLATGTQVILEQAEGVLGGQFSQPITAEAVQSTTGDDFTNLATDDDDDDESDLISKYAQQPVDIKEGVQSAYKSLRRNFNSAAQTILAVPMEVYERSGNEGPVRSVIRAVPIAVLKPMIGASEAVSKTLLGLHNTLDPDVRHENEAKYKRR